MIEQRPRLSLVEHKIYSALKASGSDGSTSVLALIKIISPTHTINGRSRASMYNFISAINKKILPVGESIHNTGEQSGNNRGYALITQED